MKHWDSGYTYGQELQFYLNIEDVSFYDFIIYLNYIGCRRYDENNRDLIIKIAKYLKDNKTLTSFQGIKTKKAII